MNTNASNPLTMATMDLGQVLPASKDGEKGDAAKNSGIAKMVDDFKKAGGTDEECDKLRQALQNTGTTGEVQDAEDINTVNNAVDKINKFAPQEFKMSSMADKPQSYKEGDGQI